MNAYIDENGIIEIEISEENEDVLKAFTIRASGKRLRRLKGGAAYNITQHLNCDNDVGFLQIPNSLSILWCLYFDFNENGIKDLVKSSFSSPFALRLAIFNLKIADS